MIGLMTKLSLTRLSGKLNGKLNNMHKVGVCHKVWLNIDFKELTRTQNCQNIPNLDLFYSSPQWVTLFLQSTLG